MNAKQIAAIAINEALVGLSNGDSLEVLAGCVIATTASGAEELDSHLRVPFVQVGIEYVGILMDKQLEMIAPLLLSR